jgi:hypothetical protein
LTRSALRAAAFGWQHVDWFGALKTGLAASGEEDIDRLENEALARGWKGEAWFAPLPPDSGKSDWAERLRRKWIGPFADFRSVLAAQQFRLDGPQLIQAARQLWRDLHVEKTLQDWSLAESPDRAVHATIWQQMNQWLDDLGDAIWGWPSREWDVKHNLSKTDTICLKSGAGHYMLNEPKTEYYEQKPPQKQVGTGTSRTAANRLSNEEK